MHEIHGNQKDGKNPWIILDQGLPSNSTTGSVCFFGGTSCDSSSYQKAGLPLIGLALGFLAPSGAKAKARSNLAAELPVRY